MRSAYLIAANFFTKLIRQRYLVLNFAARDLRSRYVGSMMGFFWAIVHPLALLLCYSVVFSQIFDIRPNIPAIGDNFAVFLFCGLLPWLFFQDTVMRACDSVVAHSSLIRKTAFPSEILPLSIVLSNLVTHLIGLSIFMLVLLYYGTPGWTLVLLPLYLMLMSLLALGIGWLTAPLQVFLRDTSQVLGVALTFWFWFTPIFYGLDRIPERFHWLFLFNPMRFVAEGYRGILLEDRLPGALELGILTGYALAAFLAGGYVFRTTKRDFIDVL